MKLQKSARANVNYLSKIVNIKDFIKHPDPEVTRIKCAYVDGFSVTISIDSEPGLYVYFPVLSQINPDLLSYLGLFRNSEKNANPEAKGFFEDKGVVKAINLRKVKSEGFLMPLSDLQNWIVSSVNVELTNVEEGTEFDEVEHQGKTFWISKKYVVPTRIQEPNGSKKINKTARKIDRLIEGQFRLHYDTILIKKCPYVIQPDDIIQVSSKWHGTSGISAYVLCHQQLNWKQKIAKWLTGEPFDKYDYLYSSRKVIFNNKEEGGYYGKDDYILRSKADSILRPFLIKGMTIYYELVGYLPGGTCIQKNYDYGCVPSTSHSDYVEGVNFKIYIYRITLTNVDGQVHEFSTQEVQLWCNARGLRPVNQLYYGAAKDLFPEVNVDDHWTENFLQKLSDSPRFYMEMNSPECDNKVPHEGIVIKKENMKSEAFKLKCFKFLNKEQENILKGESNIEDEA